MAGDILESDWKVFRQLHPVALGRFCDRLLADVSRISGDSSKSSHDRYLELYRLIQERNDEIAHAFNDFRRSTAMRQLLMIQSHRLLTDDEMARFSPGLRESVQSW